MQSLIHTELARAPDKLSALACEAPLSREW